jgi:hypothetical protein
MSCLRRAVAPIAGAWLFCQAATMTVAPVVFSISSTEELLVCTCTHGDHAICPMHHKPAPGTKICLMRSANDNGGTAILTSLLAGVGPIAEQTTIAAPSSISTRIIIEATRPSGRSAPPDPRPPRA